MAINMKEMVKQLELHEGLRLKPYYDTVDKLNQIEKKIDSKADK